MSKLILNKRKENTLKLRMSDNVKKFETERNVFV